MYPFTISLILGEMHRSTVVANKSNDNGIYGPEKHITASRAWYGSGIARAFRNRLKIVVICVLAGRQAVQGTADLINQQISIE